MVGLSRRCRWGISRSMPTGSLHSASLACPLVRRRSGGGAILHDQELTYSLAIPSSNRWSNQNSELYDLVHRVVIQLLAEEGIESQFHRDAASGVGESGDPEVPIANPSPVVDPNAFLCFQRRSDGDLVSNGFKILGSAQRRLKHSLLQHGSLLLKKSNFAPELPGLLELGGKQVEVEDFSRRLSKTLGVALGFDFLPTEWIESEVDLASELAAAQFGTAEWTQKR